MASQQMLWLERIPISWAPWEFTAGYRAASNIFLEYASARRLSILASWCVFLHKETFPRLAARKQPTSLPMRTKLSTDYALHCQKKKPLSQETRKDTCHNRMQAACGWWPLA
ncbi:hypothetical protein BU16DRAFT_343742 [Lophium mytilinum]|uniref:Uncharacterized protein n=1 Tax=Lophium mytilinum TaxID=390894 RepID=A0A6A6QZ58_9PEZI|nr:hypothetical protein BU16DRAFT_343742 [Lophium mytilinum]